MSPFLRLDLFYVCDGQGGCGDVKSFDLFALRTWGDAQVTIRTLTFWMVDYLLCLLRLFAFFRGWRGGGGVSVYVAGVCFCFFGGGWVGFVVFITVAIV